jgi:ADP-ribose pyrophosphatase
MLCDDRRPMNRETPDSGNPFRTLSQHAVYDNAWIRVTEHQILNPAGKPGIYGVIHFKNHAVAVVPYREGKIWLVGQFRFPLDQYSWEVPEGGAPHGEALEEAARRELREETGLEARSLTRILTMHLSNSVTDEAGTIFLATGLRSGVAAPEETEELRTREISLDEAYSMVNRGEITDSLSVAAILKIVLLRAEGALPADSEAP